MEAMKTRIEQRFDWLKNRQKKGFVAYITAGDPTLKATVEIVLRLEDAGVDIVELGIPFSDPLADGRVNQQAAARALAHGTTLDGVLDCVLEIRKKSDIPLLFFCYLNPLIARGFESVLRRAVTVGVDGFLILDLPVEEAGPYARDLARHHLNNVCLVAPTSPDERIRRIVRASTGFVYCVSREGVTGMQKHLSSAAVSLIQKTKRLTKLPVALGFGISSPAQAQAAAKEADAVVVGSAIVDRFASEPHTSKGRAEAAAWVKNVVQAVRRV
jgi:tryptophan synthase alpha chain